LTVLLHLAYGDSMCVARPAGVTASTCYWWGPHSETAFAVVITDAE